MELSQDMVKNIHKYLQADMNFHVLSELNDLVDFKPSADIILWIPEGFQRGD